MNDETQTVPDDGSQVAQPESSQTETAPVTTETTPQASLSLQDVERLLGERESKLRAEFESRERKWQSKSDKAYAKALAEAKVIEDNAELLGLEPEQVKAAKQAVINRQFDSTFSQPEEPEVPALPPALVGADEIRSLLAQQGIVDEAMVAKYAGKPRISDTAWAEWDMDLTLAKASKYQQAQAAKQQKQQAAQAAQVKATVGRVSPVPGNGVPAQGYDPNVELEKMDKEGMPSNPAALTQWKARYAKLMKEAYPD